MGMKLKIKIGQPFLFSPLMTFNHIKTDNFIFRIHYKFTFFIILFVYTIYCKTLWKYDILSCSNSAAGKNNEIASTFCFATSVYSVTLDNNDKKTGSNPGVIGFDDLDRKENVRYHKYYQFTPFILLVQIIILITPRYLWRCYEDGKIAMFCEGITGKGGGPVLDKGGELYKLRRKWLGEYFVGSLGYNNPYAFFYAGCEVLNMVSVVFQLYFLDVATGNVFSTHGLGPIVKNLLQSGGKDDPLSFGFPLVAKCTYAYYGPSGNIVPHSAVCTLPLNLVTKIYIGWFWVYLIVLVGLNTLNLIYRVATIGSYQIRLHALRKYALISKSDLRYIMKKCVYGDWFILTLLAKNLDPEVFIDIMNEVVHNLQLDKVNA